MVIFNSYVSLPEGIMIDDENRWTSNDLDDAKNP